MKAINGGMQKIDPEAVPPKNVRLLILEYVDCKKNIFFMLKTC